MTDAERSNRPLAAKVAARVRRDGVRGTLSHALEVIGPRLNLAEMHIWYAVELDRDRPRPPLPPGFRQLRATQEHLPLLERLAGDVSQGRTRMESGADLWFVIEEGSGDPVFRVWTFYDQAPVYAAPGGILSMPPGVVNLEDAITSARVRGLGIAPAGYAAVFDQVAKERAGTTMVAKPPEENAPQRRAMEKAGFRPFARQRFVRRGPYERVLITPYGEGLAAWLAAEMTR